ncbi:ricin-type beta-trefoil lectin domain protein [Actinoplanes sp. NPDC049265]|uniref:ricin-type beta-trefoil lectin domain protein n=1 Tax=Actinoplanes sp. NPDC049265 TaxID=3363902 RepID=UPI003719A17D
MRLSLPPKAALLNRRVLLPLIAAVAALSVAVTAAGYGVASADDDHLVGKALSDQQVEALTEAATSCPALTPARLAGQLMVESGLDESAQQTASGGRGLAGLSDTVWQKWTPWSNAGRMDPEANIIALAHRMCDLSGQIRSAGVTGDAWQLSLAAYRSGVAAVRQAGRVPDAAAEYVRKADGYAAYYASLPYLGGGEPRTVLVDAPANQAKPIPDEYVQPLVRAGAICPEVSAAAVAGQIMTLSGFDAGKVGPRGERGVAQFRSDIWERYAPRSAAPGDIKTAVPAVGTAMCAMVRELGGLPGDPYLAALWAYKAGTDTVRRSSGSPQGATTTYLKQVAAYTDTYKLDTRLKGGATTPAVPPTAPVTSKKPLAAASATGKATPPKEQEPTKKGTTGTAKKPAAPRPGVSFVQLASKRCIDAGAGTDWTQLTEKTCTNSDAQRWDVRGDGTIRVLSTGLCMDVRMGEKGQGVVAQVAICNGTTSQQWTIVNNMLRTLLIDNCVDSVGDGTADGTKLEMVQCQAAGHSQQTWKRRK